ncbi:hypothetical protein [Halobacillus litoralis]|uniref:hypothetical protein n=1 Tax=Halobacillus litoralis TaxID=45668 RepID=UPI00136C68DA|nr:hypothetical protein [Halobacillus litoralis]MCA1023278.1 hypothetical protein [Halobacillus litoralis]MYL38017.1 hypothetical protein [Halobacillus litoralis]
MGQVCKVVFISLIFTLMPLSLHAGWGEGATEQWDRFYNQYRSLLHDGKNETAERLLHSRVPDMEKYIEGLSAEDQAAWEHVSRSEEEGRLSETALIFFEVLASEDKERALEQKLMAFHMGMFTVPVDHVIQDWETLEPVVMHVHASAETGQVRHALEQYQLQPTSESAAAASAMVEALINGGSEENVSFIGMTAGVGGFIIAVLFYVGILKHPARSKIRHTIKERNS